MCERVAGIRSYNSSKGIIAPPHELTLRLARRLFDIMEMIDPSGDSDLGWDAASDLERSFWITCIRKLLLSAELDEVLCRAHRYIVGRRIIICK